MTDTGSASIGSNGRLPEVYIERLRLQRDELRRHGPDRFAMGTWFTHDGDQLDWQPLMKDAHYLTALLSPPWCGTTACIAGHAVALWPELANEHTSVEDVSEFLGMFETNHSYNTEWLYRGTWPYWAELAARNFDSTRTLYHSGHPRTDFDVVMWVLDDLISGRRPNWYAELDDDDTTDVGSATTFTKDG